MIRFFIYLTTLLLSFVLFAQNDSIKPNLPKLTFEISAGLGTGNYEVQNQPNLNGNSTLLSMNLMYRASKTLEFGLGYYQSTFNANTMFENEWSEISRTSTLVPVQARFHFDLFNTYNSPFDFYVGIGAGPNFAIKEKIESSISTITDKSQKTNWKYLVNFGLNIALSKQSFFTINYTNLGDINATKYNNIERKLNSGTINMGFGYFY